MWPILLTPFSAQVGPKNDNFQRFRRNIFITTGLQLKFLILIKSLNIFHRKPTKKSQNGCGLGAKFRPN